MKLTQLKGADDLINYLREFSTIADDPYVYDRVLVMHLLMALLDNARENFIEGDYDEMPYFFTDEQRTFITRFAEYANRLSDSDIENEPD